MIIVVRGKKLANPIAHQIAKPVRVELNDFAVLSASGLDAQAFMKEQFCNDLEAVSATHAQLSGNCNPKGRLLALFVVVAVDDGYRSAYKCCRRCLEKSLPMMARL